MKDKRRDEMLIQFNSDYEKISMGLLSFIEDFKDPARLQEEIERYKISEERDLFLWQSEETGNLIGLIGIEKENDYILLRHISIDPSFRNEGISYRMLEALNERYPNNNIVSTLETASIVSSWQRKRAEE
ncbi:MAG TPA: GNAT family N-acetyltransferase [Atopostipes sp.]|nr:GNAT family N-acetyltransferase [Atopostipes sp.]